MKSLIFICTFTFFLFTVHCASNCTTPNCVQCNTQNVCIQCNSSSSNKYLSNGQCVIKCPLTTGHQANSNICVNCSANCQICYSTDQNNTLICGLCTKNYYMQETECVSGCNSNQFINPMNYCVQCDYMMNNCLTCFNSTTCSSCNLTTYLSSGQCVSSCPANTPFIFYGSCVAKCPTKYGHLANNNTCQQCSQNCAICYSTTNSTNLTCGVCQNGSYLLNGFCLSSCPAGYISQNFECDQCPSTSSIIYNNQCVSSCPSNMFAFNNSCVSKCPLGWGHLAGNNTCQSCGDNCAICYSITNTSMLCGLCESNYFLLAGNCLTSCPPGYNGQDTQCKQCPGNCSSCVMSTATSGQCSQCFGNFVLNNAICSCPNTLYFYNSTCAQSCPQGSFNLNDTCVNYCTYPWLYYGNSCVQTCPSNAFVDNIFNCTNCDPNCLTCNGNSTNCTSCANNAVLTPQNTCGIPTCPSGYIYDQDSQKCIIVTIQNATNIDYLFDAVQNLNSTDIAQNQTFILNQAQSFIQKNITNLTQENIGDALFITSKILGIGNQSNLSSLQTISNIHGSILNSSATLNSTNALNITNSVNQVMNLLNASYAKNPNSTLQSLYQSSINQYQTAIQKLGQSMISFLQNDTSKIYTQTLADNTQLSFQVINASDNKTTSYSMTQNGNQFLLDNSSYSSLVSQLVENTTNKNQTLNVLVEFTSNSNNQFYFLDQSQQVQGELCSARLFLNGNQLDAASGINYQIQCQIFANQQNNVNPVYYDTTQNKWISTGLTLTSSNFTISSPHLTYFSYLSKPSGGGGLSSGGIAGIVVVCIIVVVAAILTFYYFVIKKRMKTKIQFQEEDNNIETSLQKD